jgi:hypothetical protein
MAGDGFDTGRPCHAAETAAMPSIGHYRRQPRPSGVVRLRHLAPLMKFAQQRTLPVRSATATSNHAHSIRAHVGGPGDRRPGFDLLPDESGEFFGRAAGNIHGDAVESFLHVGAAQDRADILVQFRDDGPRRFRRRVPSYCNRTDMSNKFRFVKTSNCCDPEDRPPAFLTQNAGSDHSAKNLA